MRERDEKNLQETILNLWSDGLSVREIADQLGCSVSAATVHTRAAREAWRASMLARVSDLFREGWTAVEIAAHLGLHPRRAQRWIWHLALGEQKKEDRSG